MSTKNCIDRNTPTLASQLSTAYQRVAASPPRQSRREEYVRAFYDARSVRRAKAQKGRAS